jgi:hypothetical protein
VEVVSKPPILLPFVTVVGEGFALLPPVAVEE